MHTPRRGAFLSTLILVVGLAPARGVAACGEPGGPPLGTLPVPASADRDLRALIELFSADDNYVARFEGVPWSEERLDREAEFFRAWQGALAGLDFDGLDQQGRVDYLLLRNSLENRLSRLDLDRRRLAEMDALLPFRRRVQDLEWSRRRLEPFHGAAAADALVEVPELVKKAREAVEAGRKADAPAGTARVTPVVALRAAGAVDRLRETFARWCEYNEGFKPDFSWWMKDIRPQVESSLAEYAKYLREEVAGVKGKPEDPLIGDPIGREALLADLKAEHIAYTPEEFIAIGEREFAWCEAEMRKASNAMGFGDDWKAALEKVKKSYVPPGDQDGYVRDEARAAVKFLKEHDLVTVPALCEESWRVEMHSPSTQRVYPFAVYGGQYMGVSYPTDAMSHADKMMSLRGNNRHFTHNVVPHELIPGHHLQGFYAQRSRGYRGEFSTPFLVEGWALYWEFRLLDLGWAGATGNDAEMDRVGILFWRMHRCARIIVSLRFHLGEMSPQQMIDYLVDRVGHERSGATSEVRRFIGGDYSPLYQCGYMMGGLQLRALHEELVTSGGLSEKQFHDTVLGYNSIPVELIRAGMTNQPLTRETAPSWRFMGTP